MAINDKDLLCLEIKYWIWEASVKFEFEDLYLTIEKELNPNDEEEFIPKEFTFKHLMTMNIRYLQMLYSHLNNSKNISDIVIKLFEILYDLLSQKGFQDNEKIYCNLLDTLYMALFLVHSNNVYFEDLSLFQSMAKWAKIRKKFQYKNNIYKEKYNSLILDLKRKKDRLQGQNSALQKKCIIDDSKNSMLECIYSLERFLAAIIPPSAIERLMDCTIRDILSLHHEPLYDLVLEHTRDGYDRSKLKTILEKLPGNYEGSIILEDSPSQNGTLLSSQHGSNLESQMEDTLPNTNGTPLSSRNGTTSSQKGARLSSPSAISSDDCAQEEKLPGPSSETLGNEITPFEISQIFKKDIISIECSDISKSIADHLDKGGVETQKHHFEDGEKIWRVTQQYPKSDTNCSEIIKLENLIIHLKKITTLLENKCVGLKGGNNKITFPNDSKVLSELDDCGKSVARGSISPVIKTNRSIFLSSRSSISKDKNYDLLDNSHPSNKSQEADNSNKETLFEHVSLGSPMSDSSSSIPILDKPSASEDVKSDPLGINRSMNSKDSNSPINEGISEHQMSLGSPRSDSSGSIPNLLKSPGFPGRYVEMTKIIKGKSFDVSNITMPSLSPIKSIDDCMGEIPSILQPISKKYEFPHQSEDNSSIESEKSIISNSQMSSSLSDITQDSLKKSLMEKSKLLSSKQFLKRRQISNIESGLLITGSINLKENPIENLNLTTVSVVVHRLDESNLSQLENNVKVLPECQVEEVENLGLVKFSTPKIKQRMLQSFKVPEVSLNIIETVSLEEITTEGKHNNSGMSLSSSNDSNPQRDDDVILIDTCNLNVEFDACSDDEMSHTSRDNLSYNIEQILDTLADDEIKDRDQKVEDTVIDENCSSPSLSKKNKESHDIEITKIAEQDFSIDFSGFGKSRKKSEITDDENILGTLDAVTESLIVEEVPVDLKILDNMEINETDMFESDRPLKALKKKRKKRHVCNKKYKRKKVVNESDVNLNSPENVESNSDPKKNVEDETKKSLNSPQSTIGSSKFFTPPESITPDLKYVTPDSAVRNIASLFDDTSGSKNSTLDSSKFNEMNSSQVSLTYSEEVSIGSCKYRLFS